MSDHDFRKELDDAYPIQSNRLSKQNIGFVGANRNKNVDLGIGGISLSFDTPSANLKEKVCVESPSPETLDSDKPSHDVQNKDDHSPHNLTEPEPSKSSSLDDLDHPLTPLQDS